MNLKADGLKNEEKVVFDLRSLYREYGYSQYKMNKFEEYDLYARNKDFLFSDGVITFTDTNGKLMALKPDVTLSIVRNSRDGQGGAQKVYYNENVYRVSQSTHTFRESTQVGLECIGDIDGYCVAETLLLAAQSLEKISEDYRLYISDLDALSAAIAALGAPESAEKRILRCVEQKNLHELDAACRETGADEGALERLKALVSADNRPEAALRAMEQAGCDGKRLDRMKSLIEILSENGYLDKTCVDFSIVGNMSYYNGIVFKGYIGGIPTSVLSGGQYDHLMRKMGRKAGAIGFAIYLDALERLGGGGEEYDADMLLLYDEDADVAALCRTVKRLTSLGIRVVAQKQAPAGQKFRQTAHFSGSGVEILEDNA